MHVERSGEIGTKACAGKNIESNDFEPIDDESRFLADQQSQLSQRGRRTERIHTAIGPLAAVAHVDRCCVRL